MEQISNLIDWYVLHPDIWALVPYTSPLLILSLVLVIIPPRRVGWAFGFATIFGLINGIQFNVHTGFEPTRLGIGLLMIGIGTACLLTEWARRREQCSSKSS